MIFGCRFNDTFFLGLSLPSMASASSSIESKDPLLACVSLPRKHLCLASVREFETIDLRGRLDVMCALAKNSRLESLDLTLCTLGEAEMEVLMTSSSIHTLTTPSSDVTERMCAMMAANPHLTSLFAAADSKSVPTLIQLRIFDSVTHFSYLKRIPLRPHPSPLSIFYLGFPRPWLLCSSNIVLAYTHYTFSQAVWVHSILLVRSLNYRS